MLILNVLNSTATHAQWTINESFEGGLIPADWRIYDENGDNNKFIAVNKPSHAKTGDWVAFVETFSSTGHDWLVTPQVLIREGDELTFSARSWYGFETLNVRVSTTGFTIRNFKITLANVKGIGTTYQDFTYDLSDYAGQKVYLAIEWIRNDYALVIDDVKVGQKLQGNPGFLPINNPLRLNIQSRTSNPSVTP